MLQVRMGQSQHRTRSVPRRIVLYEQGHLPYKLQSKSIAKAY